MTLCIAIDARSLNLSRKELNLVGEALKSTLSKHIAKNLKISGTFTFVEDGEDPDNYDISVDVVASETQNGVLSGELI